MLFYQSQHTIKMFYPTNNTNNFSILTIFIWRKSASLTRTVSSVWIIRSAVPLYEIFNAVLYTFKQFCPVVLRSCSCITILNVWSGVQKYQEITSTKIRFFCLVGKRASRSQGMLMAMNSVSSLQYAAPYVLEKQPPVTQQSCRSTTPVWPLFMNSWLKPKARVRAHVHQKPQHLRSMCTERMKPWRTMCRFNWFMVILLHHEALWVNVPI